MIRASRIKLGLRTLITNVTNRRIQRIKQQKSIRDIRSFAVFVMKWFCLAEVQLKTFAVNGGFLLTGAESRLLYNNRVTIFN